MSRKKFPLRNPKEPSNETLAPLHFAARESAGSSGLSDLLERNSAFAVQVFDWELKAKDWSKNTRKFPSIIGKSQG